MLNDKLDGFPVESLPEEFSGLKGIGLIGIVRASQLGSGNTDQKDGALEGEALLDFASQEDLVRLWEALDVRFERFHCFH